MHVQSNESETWVDNFLKTKIGSYFVRIDQNYIKDQFNSYGLKAEIENFKAAYDRIQGKYKPPNPDDPRSAELERSAYHLYGLLHKRYIQSQQGCKELYEHYKNGVYGKCPLVSCNGSHCLPYGITEQHKRAFLCVYCPCCHEVYIADAPMDSIDGAYFGHSYLMVFIHSFRDKLPLERPNPPKLRLFGFKIEDPQPTEESLEEEDL